MPFFSAIVLAAELGRSRTPPASSARAQTPAAASSPPAQPTQSEPGCGESEVSFEQAFSTPIGSVPVLGFVSRVGALPAADQQRLFDAVVANVRADPAATQSVLREGCTSIGTDVAAKRGLVLIANEWALGELADAKRFDDFSAGYRAAVEALALGDQIAPETSKRVLAPFDVHFGDVSAAPLDPPPSDDCASNSRPARALAAKAAAYPQIARDERLAGTIVAIVVLDKFGFVEAAQIARTDIIGVTAGMEALRHSSLVAAAASTYVPGCRGTEPFGGRYLFQIHFNAANPPGP